MILKLQATSYEMSEGDAENLAYIWLCDDSVRPRRYLSVCRKTDTATEAPIYVERDDQSWAAYDAVDGWNLARGRFIVRIDEACAQKLGGVDGAVVEFKMTTDEFDRLKLAAEVIFKNVARIDG